METNGRNQTNYSNQGDQGDPEETETGDSQYDDAVEDALTEGN